MRKKILYGIAAFAALIILLMILKNAGVIGEEKGVKVYAEKVGGKTIIETVTASGKIYPEVEVKVSPDVSGEITELMVMEGDSVKKGQVLAKIFADIYGFQEQQAAAQLNQQQFQVATNQAQLLGLKSALNQAEITYNRQKLLVKDRIVSKSEFEQAENAYLNAKSSYYAAQKSINGIQAGVQGAKANLAKASKDASRATIVAPMDGVVSLLNVKKGERVVGTAQMAGTEMMRVADFKSIEIRVDVPENDIPKVHIGDSAIVTVDAYIGKKFRGTVYQIASSQNGAVTANVINSANDVTNYRVYIRLIPESYKSLSDSLPTRSLPFRPGMTASAEIQTKIKNNVVAVPINAVTTRDKNEENKTSKDIKKTSGKPEDEIAASKEEEDTKEVVVYVLQAGGLVKKTVVKTGIQDTKYIEIVEGLKGGEEVVCEPYNIIFKVLKDGMKVLPVASKEKLFEATK